MNQKKSRIAMKAITFIITRSVVIFALFLLTAEAKAQNFYSGGTGNYNTIQWYLDQNRTVSAGVAGTVFPGAGNTVNIGNGHNVTIPNATTVTFAGMVVHDTGASGTLTYGTANPNTVSTMTITGNLTINNSGFFTVAGNGVGSVLNTLNVGGNIVNNNVMNMIATNNDRANLVLNGTSDQTISGSGVYTLFGVILSTNAHNVNVNSNLPIYSNLNWTVNGKFILNSTSNITMGSGATITNSSSSRYIESDGSTGSGGQLIVTNNNTTAAWQILYPIGSTTGGYTPFDLSTAGGATLTNAPTANSTLAVKAIYNPSIPGQMRRQFRVAIAGNNVTTTTFRNADFYYNTGTDISAGDIQSNYNALWYLTASGGTWLVTTGTAPGGTFFTAPTANMTLKNDTYFFAIGNSTAFTNVWYSYQNGDWSDSDTWTLDPSGTSLLNPLNQSPLAGDQVVILNGFTVNNDVNNVSLSSTTIQGGAILDMQTSTGNTLGIVTGSGLLRIKGVSLPSGSYQAFVASTGGTIEYYDIGGTLSTTQTTYNQLIFSNSTGSAITYVEASDLTVNGNLNITQNGGGGTVTWQINNTFASSERTILLNGDLTVSEGGQIRAGTGNSGTPHDLTILGNLTNRGSIKFFDFTDATYAVSRYQNRSVFRAATKGNTVNVTFSGIANQTVTCDNQTEFYRLIVDKGTGQQAMLTVNSADTTYFRLYGPTGIDGMDGAAPNYLTRESLLIKNGTLQLTGNIKIRSLIENSGGNTVGWPIPQNGALWLNGNNVTIQSTPTYGTDDWRHVYVFGKLRITAGTFNTGYSRGLLGGGSGVVLIEGGALHTWQLRTTYLGSGNNFAYTQTGGTVTVGTTITSGVVVDTYPRFALPYSTCSFTMTGGSLSVGLPMDGGTSDNGGILISSATSNINVTGGTVNAIIPNTGADFTITSTAPFYNLSISKGASGSTSAAVLNSMVFDDATGSSAASRTLAAQSLVVLNDLTLVTNNLPQLKCNAKDVTIGGDFIVSSNTTFTPGANTITFNGSGAQAWNHSGTITSLNNVTVNKSAGVLTLGGSANFPSITGTTGLVLTSGTLADGGKTLTVTGGISNSAVHTSTGSGSIVVSIATPASTVLTTTTIGGNNGTFGNLTILNNGPAGAGGIGVIAATSGAQTVTGNLALNGPVSASAATVMSIASYSLTVLGNITTTGASGFGSAYRIQTNGLYNAGGLTRQAAAGDLVFPIGSTTISYTPVTINVAATTYGTITVRPVNGEHPLVTATGHSLLYYWRVTSSGFSGVSAVSHKLYTYSNAGSNGVKTAYSVARYDPITYTWAVAPPPTFSQTAVTSMPTFSFGTNIDGEYTAGDSAPFGAPKVFYSRSTGLWNANTTWSNSPCTGPGACGAALPAGTTAGTNFPAANNPVVIGDANNAHVVTIDQNSRSCGTLMLNSVLNCSTFTGLNFGASIGGGGSVSGNGTLRINSNIFPAGDFTNFLGQNGGTVEWYGTTKTIPTTGALPQQLNLSAYFNLVINPDAGQTITLPATNLRIYNDLTKNGAGIVTNDNVARTHTVDRDFTVNAGTFTLINSTPAASLNIAVQGNVSVGSGAIFGVPAAAGGTAVNTLSVSGGITNNGTLRFSNGNVVNIVFLGSDNVAFDGTGSVAVSPNGTTLSKVTVNKGSNQVATVNFTVGGTVTAASSNWLTLMNGAFSFNNGGTYTISSASAVYNIPATAKLKVQSGTVNITSTASDAADLTLGGTLEVAGGTVNVGASGNNVNNDIEYASAGAPTITVSGGTLYVNGAIRRPTTTLDGSLQYAQASGTVTVGGRNVTAAGNNTRGVFEIDNNGSFAMGSTAILNIVRPTGGSSFADFYLNPGTATVDASSTVQLGLSTTAQTIDINVTPALGNLTILGDATNANAQTVNMQSSPLTVAGTLTINANSFLNPTALDVTIGGNLSILTVGANIATYNGGANTTTFNGSGPQAAALTTGSSFMNVTVNKPTGTLTMSGSSPTITNLNILSGVLDVGSLNLSVIGDIVNNSSQIGAGSISLAGNTTVVAQRITSSGGTFQNLTLTGTATTKTITVVGNTVINGTLNFAAANRYFNIGSGLLTFGTTAAVTGAANNAFIKTNGSASDLGVVKNWAAGTGTFVYAVGTRSNYTPVTFTGLVVSAPGDLTVVPVDDRHPTSNTGSLERVLNYYWIVTRGSTLNYGTSGTHSYDFPNALLGGSGGTLLAGYLNIASTSPGWVTSNSAATPGGTINGPTTTTMTYTNFLNVNLPTAGNTFHYSVGTPTVSSPTLPGTLPNPIVSVYSRIADASVSNMNVGGDWNDPNSWTLTAGGNGPVWGSIPYGISVVIVPNSRINIAQSGRIAFITKIDGLLVLPGNKVGHNMGILRGTGTLRTPINTFPAGNYTDYVSAAGGTIEYVAPMTMNNRSTYNNISIIGTGGVIMTNTDLTLNGSVTIASGSTLNNSVNNRNMTLAGSWTNNGTFNTGTGTTVTINGAFASTISGTTAFNNLVIAKSGAANVTLAGTGTTTVNTVLTLTSGDVVSSATHLLSLPSAATISGGSVNSFIAGPVRKVLPGAAFFFPLGSITGNRYRPAALSNTTGADTWTAEYIGNNPTTGLFPNTSFNSTNVKKVSQFEYWVISRTGATGASLELTYDVGSYIPNPTNIGNVANLRVVRWNGTQWDLPPGAAAFSQTGTNVTGTVRVDGVTSFSPFTFGSLDFDSPLPVKWGPVDAVRVNRSVEVKWVTLQEENNDRFEVERSEDGVTFVSIGSIPGAGNISMKQTYRFMDNNASMGLRYYYRIRQVDYNGLSDYSPLAMVMPADGGELQKSWIAYPNPLVKDENFVLYQSDNAVPEQVQIILYSSQGILLYQGTGSLEEMNMRVNKYLQDAHSGVYMLQVSDGTLAQGFKIVRP